MYVAETTFVRKIRTFNIDEIDGSPFVDVEKSGDNQFVAAGIHLTVLEPMRRWRILFNGMLKYVLSQSQLLFLCKQVVF